MSRVPHYQNNYLIIQIKDLDNVEFVEEETFAEASLSWALDRIDQVSPVLDGIFEPEGDGEGVDIYILDTGINVNHNEFDGNRAIYPGYDPVDNYYGTNPTGQDCDGHGTHVASLACGKTYGVAKKANCYSVPAVQTRRVIRAAPGIETTGQYMVVLTLDTSHERFEAIAEKVQSQSLSSDIYKIEGEFAKVIVTELSEAEAHQIKDLDNVEFIEEETFAEASLSWALDRIDQVSPVLDGIFEPEGDGEVDNYYGTNQTGRDCRGHGTHVASLACGKNYGVAKKANCYSVRVLGCTGRAPWSIVIDGLNYVATNITNKNPHRPTIISMSLS
ncbi:LOW QUALITY PROTEIN: proteinase R-like, partial [Gigantopelta aegis]|uniref:LOW QUALITY PROTEIN: proteinase R-like n=1 Tax=Gigantopelta aegis TaxID=1735272 RepID=UPI001B888880